MVITKSKRKMGKIYPKMKTPKKKLNREKKLKIPQKETPKKYLVIERSINVKTGL